MADHSLRSLEAVLRDVMEVGPDLPPEDESVIRALVHAYGVVDAVHRFREIVRVFPGLKKRAPFRVFMDATKSVEDLRDHIQHLNGKLSAVAEGLGAAMGILTWLGPSPRDDAPPSAWTIIPGSVYPQQFSPGPVVDTYAHLSSGEIRNIRLVAGKIGVDLQAVVTRVCRFLQSLEASLQSLASGKPLLSSDMTFVFELVPVDGTQNATVAADESRPSLSSSRDIETPVNPADQTAAGA